ncbi:MAG: hypothetical protein RL211_578 [Pseudomonadota bacterium]|jgi:hypothetical protein
MTDAPSVGFFHYIHFGAKLAISPYGISKDSYLINSICICPQPVCQSVCSIVIRHFRCRNDPADNPTASYQLFVSRANVLRNLATLGPATATQ